MTNPQFAEAFRRLAGVRLNPRRHTADNALAHSEAVSARAGALARANNLAAAEVQLLEDLGRAHDIGKIGGTARPDKSLDVLRTCGVDDARFLALVKWHDTNLPWWNAHVKGQPPSDKAWRRLAAEVDVPLLALFMVADRVDAPAGWRRNAPVTWFLAEAKERGLIRAPVLDLPGEPSEISAGGALVVDDAVLVIRVRAEGYELPKGGIEWDELPAEAAARELREEAGVASAVTVGRELGHLDYDVGHGKRVRYFAMAPASPLALDALPDRTRERRWIRRDELAALPLVSEALRAIVAAAVVQVSTR